MGVRLSATRYAHKGVAPCTPPQRSHQASHIRTTLLYRTIAEHFETWLELASAGQFDGQRDHHAPTCARRFANTSNAASSPTALSVRVLHQAGNVGDRANRRF